MCGAIYLHGKIVELTFKNEKNKNKIQRFSSVQT